MAMFLRLNIDGVDDARILIGLRAAMAVFDAHKVHPYAADEGRWACIVADETGDELLARHAELGAIWAQAEIAAIDAACTLDDGRQLPSRNAQLSVFDDSAVSPIIAWARALPDSSGSEDSSGLQAARPGR